MGSAPATRMPGSHHRAEVNGIRLHYTRAGSGEPLVLLHGFPMTSCCWRRIMPALAERFTVIAPDLRGCGDSDRPTAGYDKRTVAEDVHQLVRSLDLGPVNLVGHDVGMMVAYAYASRHPAEVRRLVLMEAALAGFGLEELYDASRTPRMFHLPLFEAPNGRETLFVAHMMRQQAYDTTALEADALEEYARHLSAPGALHGGIEYFRAHTIDAEHNREHARTRLPMPVLTVGGTASFGVHLEGQIRPLAANMRAVMIDRCGHYLAEEQPEQLTEELLKFLGEPA